MPPRSPPPTSKTSVSRSRPRLPSTTSNCAGRTALEDIYNRTVEADQEAPRYHQGPLRNWYRLRRVRRPGRSHAPERAGAPLLASPPTVPSTSTPSQPSSASPPPVLSCSHPVKSLTTPIPPIPVGVPSELLQRRPDIAAAERTHGRSQCPHRRRKSRLLPLTSRSPAQAASSPHAIHQPLLRPLRFFWSVGGSASETIFDGWPPPRYRSPSTRAQFDADVAALQADRPHRLPAGRGLHRHPPHQLPADPACQDSDAFHSAQRYLRPCHRPLRDRSSTPTSTSSTPRTLSFPIRPPRSPSVPAR